MNRLPQILIWLLLPIGALLLGYLNLFHGPLNQDEGWYLYAAGLTAEGQLPVRDFAFTQGPIHPLVYSLCNGFVESHGVIAGRIFTLLLGLASWVFAALLATRLAPKHKCIAVWTCLILGLLNVYQGYFFTIVKTYALAGLFLTAGLYTLSFVRKGGWVAPVLGAILLALAAGTRLSLGFALPAAGLWMLCSHKSLGHRPWLLFGAGGLLTLLAVFLPFFASSTFSFTYLLTGYHTARESDTGTLLLKAGFLSRVTQAYFIATFLVVARLLIRDPQDDDRDERDTKKIMLWIVLVGTSAVHFLSPFPYDDYQAPLFPLLCALLGASWAPLFQNWGRDRCLGLLALACFAGSFSSPVNQDWFIIGRDRIWWTSKEKSDLQQLREAATELNARCPVGKIFTMDLYLAVEANRKVPHGLEMGPFSYNPDLDDATAESAGILNRTGMIKLLSEPPLAGAALTDFSFAIDTPGITETDPEHQREYRNLLKARFPQQFSLPHFGQGHTTLEILSP